MSTQIDTAALRALAAKATPGPWQHHGSHFYGPGTPEEAELIGQALSNNGRCQPDRDIIVAAVNALGPLCDEVERLQAINAELAMALEEIRDASWPGTDAVARIQHAARAALGDQP